MIITRFNLSALGFYTGPINGDLSSEVTRRAISNFQKVYGLNPTDGNANTSFRRKLNEAVSVYENVITNPSMPELANNSKMQFDYNQIHNFAKVWTFLNVSRDSESLRCCRSNGKYACGIRFLSDKCRE